MAKTYKIYMCGNQRAGGAGCISPGARDILQALTEQAKARDKDIEVIKSTCLGYCSEGPNVKIHHGAVFNQVQLEDIGRILDAVKPSLRRKMEPGA